MDRSLTVHINSFEKYEGKCYSLKDLNFNVLAQQTTTDKGILYTSNLNNCYKT